jgi:NADPH:quinone reductase-like Zn-dependent oxidoreductase
LSSPFAAGFEALGTVVKIGSKVTSLLPGDTVATMSFGSFSEYQILSERQVFLIPSLDPRFLGLMVNGLTAYLALHKAAQIKKDQIVLVTGAAGATGQIAVQVARAAGCIVLGTCGSEEKASELRNLGIHRAINYKTENLALVLRKEFPKGVDVVFEGVGGDMLKSILAKYVCSNSLQEVDYIRVIGRNVFKH